MLCKKETSTLSAERASAQRHRASEARSQSQRATYAAFGPLAALGRMLGLNSEDAEMALARGVHVSERLTDL